ncbi:hypothetical protein BVC80_1037g47 [Macleaya cordata]|uniref:RNase H type-1 domain-containing protein n=1 Tax=Macleaya cordata TaxID=56857 RepID=A0A200QVQ4_MACCD|nr:hypothetical protein BVC80_1037g47 [Macleaya cordata]
MPRNPDVVHKIEAPHQRHDLRCWNQDLIRDCFPIHEAEAILSIRLSSERTDDQLLWLQTPNGNFTSKSAYKLLMKNEPSASNSSSSSLETSDFNWKAYWHLKGISPRLPICYLKPETADHIFLKCDVARQVWFGSHIGLTIDESDDTLTLTRLFNGWLSCPSLFEIAKRGCCLLWSIWKARNRKIFEHVDIDISEIIRTANNIFTEHDLNIPSLIQTQPAEIQSVDDAAQHGWDKPQHGCIKINVDGATGSGSIAAGVVARNEVGMALHCQSFYDGCWSGRDASIEAEARAFLKGLHLAARYPNTTTIIEGDSKMVVSYINDDRLIFPWRIRSIIMDCRSILHSSPLLSVKFVPRTKNKAANCLAKFAISCKSSNEWMLSAPSCLSEILYSDTSASY